LSQPVNKIDQDRKNQRQSIVNIQIEDTEKSAVSQSENTQSQEHENNVDAINIPLTLKESGKRVSSTTQNSGETQAESENGLSPFEIMLQRWEAHQAQIPKVDKDDIQNDCPHFDGIDHIKDDTLIHQQCPEYSQMSYLRMRSYEEAMFFGDCFDPFCNMNYQKFIKETGRTDIINQ